MRLHGSRYRPDWANIAGWLALIALIVLAYLW